MTANHSVKRPTLTAPIEHLSGIEMTEIQMLRKLGIRRVVDLLFHFPRSYQVPAQVTPFSKFETGVRTSFVGTVVTLEERVTQTGKHMLGVQVDVDPDREGRQGCVRLLWFNQPFRKQSLWAGLRIQASGVLKSTVLNWEVVQPQVQILEAGSEPTNDSKPLPVYPLTEGLKQTQLRTIMEDHLPPLIPLVGEVLGEPVRQLLGVLDIASALRWLHFPEEESQWEQARYRFKAQELLVLQLAIQMQRTEREHNAKAPICEASGKIHARILNRFEFELTNDQHAAIQDIGRDMNRDVPMNRLLQGDVGSGKTVVAQYAMLLCVAHGLQSALMAPTEVLAQQHAHGLQRSLAASKVRVALLTGSLGSAERRLVLEKIAGGQVDLVVGTQALLSGDVRFQKLGLVIVDEQHKFGVLQRAQLRSEETQPHYLVLSATPIPRTIAMTAFGDLDVSTIRQKPPGRSAVHSYLAQADELQAWWKFVDDKVSEGRQAFVIAPRVGEQASDDFASAIGTYESLSRNEFKHRRVALLHGRMDSNEKDRTLSSFAEGSIDVLVATTVVEVGIDIPNATVMTILDANRLGLSQLHQLRGRIARGAYAGYVCAVSSAVVDSVDNKRLAAFQATNDGFELAEMDLRLRGPGDLLGTTQSGLPPMKIANLSEDADIVSHARAVARQVLEMDPGLKADENQSLRKQTVNRYGASMQLSDVG